MKSFSTATIADAATRLRRGEATARELTEACLAAIARHGEATNAFTLVHEAAARQAADAADRELAAGRDRGPLHGIPISLKDLIDEAGVPNTAGSRALDDRRPRTDAPLVARLRAAGAVLIGRTNLHEFALGTTSEDSGFGPVRNPHDLTRSPGGSSGGSAAAVLTGMSVASIGTDTGGSIRIPAAACGIVGLKPSRGDVPTDGLVPLSRTLDHAGPLALSVQDAAWVWQVLVGRPIEDVDRRAPAGLRLLRLRGYFETPLEPDVRHAFERALVRLAAAGASIADGHVDGTDTIAKTYVDIVLPEAAHWHRRLIDERGDRYSPAVRERILHGRTIAAVDYLEGLEACRRFAARIDALLDTADALVLPTLPITAPVLGVQEIEIDGVTLPVRSAMLKHTQLFNIGGQPAISLPIASGGLPVGLQLVGRTGRTRELLEVAAGVEDCLAV